MATQTSLIAQQVRIRQWAEQIRACQNRPAGMEPVVRIQNTKGLSAEIFSRCITRDHPSACRDIPSC